MIEVLSSGALATVQDLGRKGSLRWGVGTSGAMDHLALAAGNLMLGNDAGRRGHRGAGVPVPGALRRRLRVCADRRRLRGAAGRSAAAALVGASARAGQVLSLGVPRGGALRASRAYLCLAGGVDVPEVLGSRSTQLRGAFGGHRRPALRRGDTLRAGGTGPAACRTGFGLVAPALSLPLQADG